jgi:hypothetical protein
MRVRRNRYRELRLDAAAHERPAGEPEPERDPDPPLPALRAAMQHLKPDERRALILFYAIDSSRGDGGRYRRIMRHRLVVREGQPLPGGGARGAPSALACRHGRTDRARAGRGRRAACAEPGFAAARLTEHGAAHGRTGRVRSPTAPPRAAQPERLAARQPRPLPSGGPISP